jgi:uncharacterized protein YjiS (DUF1127 family)
MQESCTRVPAAESAAPLSVPQSLVGRFWARLMVCIETSRQRRALAALPDYLLRDVGLRRSEADVESAKPFWRK